jgi:hypothetical protein
VISDEVHLIGRAKEKYEGIWEKGVDYELGDLRVEGTPTWAYSSKCYNGTSQVALTFECTQYPLPGTKESS